jgi:hypothetical protein
VREPHGTHDAGVQRLRGAMIVHHAAEREAQERTAVQRTAPQIGSDECLGPQAPGGFLARLADDRFDERFSVLEMARGLVQHEASLDALFDEEKAAVALDDGGYRDLGVPAHD